MDYRAEYQKKLTAAADAVKVVKSGDWVDYGWCNGTVDALAAGGYEDSGCGNTHHLELLAHQRDRAQTR